MKTQTRQRIFYVACDYIATNIAMVVFNIVRFNYFAETGVVNVSDFLLLSPVMTGQLIMPLMMMVIYYLSGFYQEVTFRSRSDEFLNTLVTTAIGSLLIYFVVLANDRIIDRGTLFETVGIVWLVLFACVYPPRLVMTLFVVKRMHNRKVGFNTLIIGVSESSLQLYKRLMNVPRARGFNVVGFVALDGDRSDVTQVPVYKLDELQEVCDRNNILNLIVMPHRNGAQATIALINNVFPIGRQIFISPFLFQLISGKKMFGDVAGEPLINISSPAISPMTEACKRASDILLSTFALIATLPVLALFGVMIKLDSPGPVLYRQERIGYKKRKFDIIKMRSMRSDAEDTGPALSTADDPRVTRIGRFMRKYRIDELPQFWNVIKGEMSIVGPRPEREYYVKRILELAPYYTVVHAVRPGITSWGMVKFGYASTVEQMVERLNYDIVYIENISIGIDFKIVLYTVKTVLTGKGI